jgi:hypothetical protein
MTTFTIKLAYQGKQYTYTHEFYETNDAYKTVEELAEYMYTWGNYSCDCNKSDFIGRHCDKTFPEMKCGTEIQLVSVQRDRGPDLPGEV